MPLLEPVEFLEFNNIEQIKKIDKETAAVIIEPVQGEGGVYEAKEDFLNVIYEECIKNDVLLIFDEIQCGFGRTGHTWSHERSKAIGDIVIAGKGIGGGFPLSVVFYKKEIAEKITEGDHGSTYGGNPLAMASIVGAIEAFNKDNVLEKVNKSAYIFKETLKELYEYRIIKETRIFGLMVAIEFNIIVNEIIRGLQNNFILALKSGLNILRLLPSYKINEKDINEFKEKIKSIIEKIKFF
jgi:Ornithine/acetylornithine aminotransferase